MPIKKLNIDDWDFISDKEIISKLNELCDHINGEEKESIKIDNTPITLPDFTKGHCGPCPDNKPGCLVCHWVSDEKPQKEEVHTVDNSNPINSLSLEQKIMCAAIQSTQDQKITQLEAENKVMRNALEQFVDLYDSSIAKFALKQLKP